MTLGVFAALLATAAASFAAAAVAVRRDPALLSRLAVEPRHQRRSALDAALDRIGSSRVSRKVIRWDRLTIASSAVPGLIAPSRVAGAKVTLAAGGLALGILSPAPLFAPLLSAAGFAIPDLRVRRVIDERRRAASRELPVFLDLLAASVGAGLTGQLAVRASAGATEGPLAEEFDRALQAVDLGRRWRDELTAVADRLDLPELRRAVTALVRSDALGSSLSEQLSGVAADAREARRAITTERARKAPIKMLFPLVFLVLPAFLLLTVVPVLLTTLRSIR